MNVQNITVCNLYAPRNMDRANSYDVLVTGEDPCARAAIARALKGRLKSRISEHASARSALMSYANTRYDAIVCESRLANPDCWCLLRMIRSGRFGFAETPAFVLASVHEQAALAGLADEFTRVIYSSSPEDAAQQILSERSTQHHPLVLLVEDEPEAAAVAERALSKYFNVEICSDAESALTTWRARRHELIVLDLMLPGMSGAELLPLILEDQPNQPVVILTAYDATERHQELMLAGAMEFLSKPNNMRELPGLCSRLLRDRACLESARQARDAANQLVQLSDRLQAVNYNLRRGRTAEATLHLQRAIDVFRTTDAFSTAGDDLWTKLVQEFEHPKTEITP